MSDTEHKILVEQLLDSGRWTLILIIVFLISANLFEQEWIPDVFKVVLAPGLLMLVVIPFSLGATIMAAGPLIHNHLKRQGVSGYVTYAAWALLPVFIMIALGDIEARQLLRLFFPYMNEHGFLAIIAILLGFVSHAIFKKMKNIRTNELVSLVTLIPYICLLLPVFVGMVIAHFFGVETAVEWTKVLVPIGSTRTEEGIYPIHYLYFVISATTGAVTGLRHRQ